MPGDGERKTPINDFGWWPEIVGLAYALGLIWFLFASSRGFF